MYTHIALLYLQLGFIGTQSITSIAMCKIAEFYYQPIKYVCICDRIYEKSPLTYDHKYLEIPNIIV